MLRNSLSAWLITCETVVRDTPVTVRHEWPLFSDRANAVETLAYRLEFSNDLSATAVWLKSRPDSTGKLGVMGMCLGGHLAFRAAMNPVVSAGVCFYATDIHKRGLGKGMNDDSLDRIPEIKGELLMMWGRQDPHVPREGPDALRDFTRRGVPLSRGAL